MLSASAAAKDQPLTTDPLGLVKVMPLSVTVSFEGFVSLFPD
jgi:hypothetical protein